jgi:hypothetical protein
MNQAAGASASAAPARVADAEHLRGLLRYATLAPSRNNSQPWLFEIEGAEARVYGDFARALRSADPLGRELVMACGAAALNLELAARHRGRAASVELMDGGRKDGLLARVVLEEPRPPTSDEEKLFAAIPARRTNRLAFEPRDVPSGIVACLVRDAADERASLRVVEQSARAAVGDLVAEAARAQWSDPRFRAELAAWSRSNGSDALDGVPGYAHGYSDRASVLRRLMVRLRVGRGAEERRDRHFALHTRALLALCTSGDTAVDWLRAGRAMQRVLLRATTFGLSASYFGPVIEVARTRRRLRQALGERGYPQLLVRLGFGPPPRATPRRPVESVLRTLLPRARPHALAHSPDERLPGFG